MVDIEWESIGARNQHWKNAVLSAYQKLNAGDKAIIDDCVEGLCLNTRLGLQGAYELLAAIGIHSLETETPVPNQVEKP